MSQTDNVKDTHDGQGVEQASEVQDGSKHTLSVHADGMEKACKSNPSWAYLENDLEISVSFSTHTRTVKHKAKTSISAMCNNKSEQTKELSAGKDGSKSIDTGHIFKYLLFTSWFPKFQAFLTACSISVCSIISSLVNILTRPAKPQRTKRKGKIRRGKRTGNFSRKKGARAMKLKARYTEKKRDTAYRISANNGKVTKKGKKRAKKKSKMKEMRNPKPIKKLGNTTPSEGYGTEDKSKAVSPTDAIIYLEESYYKLTNTEQKNKNLRLHFLSFEGKSSGDFDLDPNTSPKYIGNFDDTDTKERDINHSNLKQCRITYLNEQAFQDTHSQCSVVSYCTRSANGDNCDDPASQQIQAAVHSNTESGLVLVFDENDHEENIPVFEENDLEENVVSVRESREERNREQIINPNQYVDLDVTRHTSNRIVSISHQRQLDAGIQQDRNRQRLPVIDLEQERLRRALMEGQMIDIHEEQGGTLQMD